MLVLLVKLNFGGSVVGIYHWMKFYHGSGFCYGTEEWGNFMYVSLRL